MRTAKYACNVQEVNSAGKATETGQMGYGSSKRVALQRAAANWQAAHPNVARAVLIVTFHGNR